MHLTCLHDFLPPDQYDTTNHFNQVQNYFECKFLSSKIKWIRFFHPFRDSSVFFKWRDRSSGNSGEEKENGEDKIQLENKTERMSYPTDRFTTLELSNPTHNIFLLHKIRQSPYLEALKF